MNIKLHYEGTSAQDAPGWAQALETQMSKQLQPLLVKHGAEDSVLHATLGKLKRGGKAFTVRLHMHLPGKKIIAASAEGAEPVVASEAAMARLFREAKKHFELLRGQDQYKRKARRERLHALKEQIAAMPETVATQAQQGIDALLQRLEAVARRELAYLRAVGDLPSDYPTVRDVVDEAAAATKAAWQPGADSDAVYRQLLKNLFKAIDREVAASRPYGEAVSLDAPVPTDAQDDAESMVEEELYEYYQPDDTLSVADVLPETVEAAAESTEQPAAAERAGEQAYVVDVLKDLPVAWRRALLLAELDALAHAAIAEVLDTTERSVASWIELAQSFIEARLGDAGIARPSGEGRVRLTVWLHGGGR
ncbi:hypothetical protein EDC62_2159 [Tibeticola sediminis]|uniref:RNA polymerase sigma factor 70 region 4 type 2 domain-containing protein n=1 Tax=Tibeticola sediminis TaxID=1917811 RepID=A0A3N4U2G6_9BURK|nr:sigma factor-like helix-turn-helix DNA-binding protein [Tibeticola sediminis]RPE65033.1 hypothetical protein EDC62_2159 [Tibeticola sediminis]